MNSNVLLTYEAHFILRGRINTQNCRTWVKRKPSCIGGKGASWPKSDNTVRIYSLFLHWPFFFFEEISCDRLQTVSVTGVRYATLLKDKVIHLQERKILYSVTFMQDGATPLISSHVVKSFGLHLEILVSWVTFISTNDLQGLQIVFLVIFRYGAARNHMCTCLFLAWPQLKDAIHYHVSEC